MLNETKLKSVNSLLEKAGDELESLYKSLEEEKHKLASKNLRWRSTATGKLAQNYSVVLLHLFNSVRELSITANSFVENVQEAVKDIKHLES